MGVYRYTWVYTGIHGCTQVHYMGIHRCLCNGIEGIYTLNIYAQACMGVYR